jgi:uncharacterized protein YndB with AHSA1/START domain
VGLKASATIEINRPIDEVFAYVADLEHMERWVEGVSNAELVSGEPNVVGARYESDYTDGGRTTRMTYEVLAVDAPTGLAMRGEGPFPFEGELHLESTAEGTRLTNTIDAGADGRFTKVVFTVLGPLSRRMMRRQLRAELGALRRELAGETPVPVA